MQDCCLDARVDTCHSSTEPESQPERGDDDKPSEPDGEALWEETPVTLCIAAACEESGEPRIVTCTDWKAENPLGTADTADKFRKLRTGWIALMAGKRSRTREFADVFERHLRNKEITRDNALTVMKDGAWIHANSLREEYCHIRWGMDYGEFREWCTKLSPVIAKSYLDELKSIRFGASLIVAGFVLSEEGKPEPLICHISQQESEIRIEEEFAAIGEGRVVAIPPLLRREYDSDVPLAKAVYMVYEAKRLAEIIGSVGESTSVDVLYPDGTLKSFTDEAYNYYDGLLKDFGPKSRITNVEFKKGFLRPFDEDESEKGKKKKSR